MKIFTAEKIRLLDELTFQNEHIASIELMERAATSFYTAFCQQFDKNTPVCVICGPGNNGGDGLAIARLLLQSNYDVSIFIYHTSSLSKDCELNKQRVVSIFPDKLCDYSSKFIPPKIKSDKSVIIDGLFGSGLSRPLAGVFLEVVKWMNNCNCQVVSIDVPSGMFCDSNTADNQCIVQASNTYTFQSPKLAFLLPETGKFVGDWKVLDIGLNNAAIESTSTEFIFIENQDIKSVFKDRLKFSHKGTYGHVLIVAGSKGMAGSSVLAARAALRTGAGLVTLHGPECNRIICQTAVPELIYSSDKDTDYIDTCPNVRNYTTVGVGCGIGNAPKTAIMLEELLTCIVSPCVIDADALNIISRNKHFMDLILENSILTPHPKEFDRLFGDHNSTWLRIMKAREIALKYKVLIVLKGAHSVIVNSDGACYFNSTGNSGLATAGSGDVLTGILTSLLAQGYLSLVAACFGVYLHGLAADIGLSSQSVESMIAGDVIENLGKAFYLIKSIE